VRIRLTYRDLMLDADALEGEYLDVGHCVRVVRDATTVLKPDGQLLLTYAPDVLPRSGYPEAFDALSHLAPSSGNRGTAAGGDRRDAPSAVLGFLDRDRNRWCRMTNFTVDNGEAYEAALPLFAAVSSLYRELAPQHWAAQNRFVERASPDFIIPGTVFSSVTLNRNWRTAAHTDSGNRRPGLEAMVVLGDGRHSGELIFPRYRMGVAVTPGGLLLADMHELHGNAPLLGPRTSIVCYVRSGMDECGTRVEEWQRAVPRNMGRRATGDDFRR
jgi:2-oxoglutarate-Fe(II)-dependent dioxygenase family protein